MANALASEVQASHKTMNSRCADLRKKTSRERSHIPPWGKEKVPWEKDMLVPRRVSPRFVFQHLQRGAVLNP